jgi:hypothetical protein
MPTMLEFQNAPAPQQAPRSVHMIGLVSTVVGGLYVASTLHRIFATVGMKMAGVVSGSGVAWALANLSLKLALGSALLAASVAFMTGRPGARRPFVLLSAALGAWLLYGLVGSAIRFGPNLFSTMPSDAVQFRNIFVLLGVPFLQSLWPLGALVLAFRGEVRAYFNSASTGPSPTPSSAPAAAATPHPRAPHDRARAA